MKKTVGLWIDHKRAVIVFVAGKDTDTRLISSNIERHHRQSGVATPADDVRQRELTGRLNSFYDEVVLCIRDAESILILGPGEAKGELKHRLEHDNLSRRIVGMRTSDKITDKQIVAVVHGHFNHKGQRRLRQSAASIIPEGHQHELLIAQCLHLGVCGLRGCSSHQGKEKALSS